MILGVAGFQNSGKTTLVEILIPIITRAGFRVATVKHIAHDDLQVDAAGTDTDRHKKAGARLAVAASDSESVYFHGQAQTLEEILARIRAMESPDLILVEGFKGSDIPKIVVGPVPHSGEALFHWDGSRDDAERIAQQIIEGLARERLEQRSATVELPPREGKKEPLSVRLAEREALAKEKLAELKRQIHVAKQNALDEGAAEPKSKRFGRRGP